MVLKRLVDNRAAATGEPEPLGEGFRRRQEVPRLRAAMANGSHEIEGKTAGVKSKLAVFGVRLFLRHIS